jgi:membrane-associated phospholipid phosphatase
LAAFTTAALLPEGAGQGALCLGFAGAVAAARIHLRAHHASDVIGGALIGGVLGVLARPLVRRVAARTR